MPFTSSPQDRLPCRVITSVVTASLFVALGLLPHSAAAQPSGSTVAGRVLDASGAIVPGAVVRLETLAGRLERSATTDQNGGFTLTQVPPGDYLLLASAPRFAPASQAVSVGSTPVDAVELTLAPAALSEEVYVVGTRIIESDETLRRLPGSVDILDLTALESARVMTLNELLRKVPGVTAREEEGFALRPNIGIRGLNPTRSSKVLLLEDGIPLTYAPYGDNASYYHPPIERFDRVEVLKGSGQIAYGPMTIGGVINYITPAPPIKPAGSGTFTAGNRDYLNTNVNYGATWGQTAMLLNYMRKQGDGARENTHSELNDLNAKFAFAFGPKQGLIVKNSYYTEDSNVTYSGLRQDEYNQNPRQNPFHNDFFYGDRYGAAVTHTYRATDALLLSTNVYTTWFRRHWWRQSSNSSQRPNDRADAACGGMANLDTGCGNEGRLREYRTLGVEARVRIGHRLFGVDNHTEMGVRAHFEDQERIQQNGDTPTARTGTVVENNERRNDAYSAFLQNRLELGALAITPGIRIERVRYRRTNRLANAGAGVTGRSDLTQLVPGIGASYRLGSRATLFGGIHRGFAPPRTEDVINNTTGGSIDLDPELSWNFELGVRETGAAGVSFDATFFRLDYQNQIVPASLAGGVGATLTNGGETLHQGIEIGTRFDSAAMFSSRHNVYTRVSYTFLPVARFEGIRYSNITGFNTVSVAGNRLPYASKHLLTATLGYVHPSRFDAAIEAVLQGDQFADDLNTIDPTADGQRGLIPSYTLWNASANYPIGDRATAFAAVKNVFDSTEIVDRSRGILPSSPRLVQFGIKVRF